MPEYTTSTTIPVDAYIHTSDKPVLYSSTTQAIKIMVRHPASADDIVLSSTAAVIWISEIDALRSAHFAVDQYRDTTGTWYRVLTHHCLRGMSDLFLDISIHFLLLPGNLPTPPILILSPKQPLTLHSTYIRFPHRMRGINLVAPTMLPYLT